MFGRNSGLGRQAHDQNMSFFCCSICGVGAHDEKQSESWMSEIRFVFQDSDRNITDRSRDLERPSLSKRFQVVWNAGWPVTHLCDDASGSSINQEPELFHTALEGYPLHEACWKIFKVLLGDAKPSVNRERMSTFFRILSTMTYRAHGQIIWPHTYLQNTSSRGSECSWKRPKNHTYTQSDPWNLSEASMTEALSCMLVPDSEEIPVLSPLPLELLHRIYSSLDRHDVESLQSIKGYSLDKMKLSDGYWKSFLLPRGEFGYFCLNGLREMLPQYSWFQIFCIARDSNIPDGLSNRHRIWKICKALADQVIDIADGDHSTIGVHQNLPYFGIDPQLRTLNIETEELSAYTRPLGSSLPMIWAPRIREILIESFEVICLHYGGSDSLRYLCGITFLPEEQSIGHITKHTRLLRVFTGKTVYLSVAFSMFGIVDISISDSGEEPSWSIDSGDFLKRKVAVKRSVLTPFKSNPRLKLAARIDACKITALAITMPEILLEEELSEIESQRQRLPWISAIPASDVNLNMDTSAGIPKSPFSSSLPFERKFRTLRQIKFPQVPIVCVTGFIPENSYRVSGLTFRFANPELHPPLTLGDEIGTAIEFPINDEAGEEISSISGILGPKEELYGILIESSAGRKGLFMGAKPDLRCEIREWKLKSEDSRFAGIYGDFEKSWDNYFLESIGVMSFGDLDCQRSSVPDELSEFHQGVESAKIISLKRDDNGTVILGDLLHYFTSQANLAGCTKISCYIQRERDIRVLGLRLEYKAGVTKANNPIILGQTFCLSPETQTLDLIDDEFLTSVQVFSNHVRAYSRYNQVISLRSISGVKFRTSEGNELLWGDEESPKSVQKFEVKPDSTLIWDFNSEYDALRVEH